MNGGIPQSEIDSPAGDQATLEAMLVGHGPMLIGISGTPDDRTAIILDTRGDIVRVKHGQDMTAGTVLAISDTQVQLQTRARRVITLSLPG